MSIYVNSLKDSIAAVRVIITDELGRTIISGGVKESFTGTDEASYNIERFRYAFIDDDSDECEININTNNPYLPDNPALQVGKKIYVKWGYFDNMKTKLVMIQETMTKYLDNKISFELVCSDINSNLKQIEALKTRQMAEMEAKDLNNWLDFFNGVYGGRLQLITGPTIIYESSGETREEPGVAVGYYDPETETTGRFLPIPTSKSTPAPYAYFTPTDQKLPFGGGKSLLDGMRDSLHGMPDGPYYIQGTDDKLVVHNRDKAFVGNVFRFYDYRGGDGDLLTFIPEIRITEQTDQINQAGIDSENKETTEEEVKSPKLTQSMKEVLQDKFNKNPNYVPSDEEIKLLALEWSKIAIEDWKNKGVATDFAFPYLEFTIKNRQINESTQSPSQLWSFDIVNPDGSITSTPERTTTAIANTSVIFSAPAQIYRIVIKQINPTQGGFFTEQMLNRVQEIEQYAYTSKFKVLGDPQLEARQLIRIRGVAKLYSGKHYINRCEHEISSGGYTVEGETIMQNPVISKFYANIKKDSSGKSEIEVSEDSRAGNQLSVELMNEEQLKRSSKINDFDIGFEEGIYKGRGKSKRVQRLTAMIDQGAFINDDTTNFDEVFYERLKDFKENATQSELEEFYRLTYKDIERSTSESLENAILGSRDDLRYKSVGRWWDRELQKRYPKVDGSKPIK